MSFCLLGMGMGACREPDAKAQPAREKKARAARLSVSGTGTGLEGRYFDELEFGSHVTTRVDPQVFFDWGVDIPGGTALTDSDTYSVRWTGRVEAPMTGTYSFITLSDDGVRLWVNDTLIIDNWTDHALTEDEGTIDLEEGELASIRLEYYESGGDAFILLDWVPPDWWRETIPTEYLYPPDSTLPDGGSAPDAGPPPDTEPPSWQPGSRLKVMDVAATGLTLAWPAAEDNQGVTGYALYRDDQLVVRTDASVRSHAVTGLVRGQAATFRVEAEDSAANASESGPSVLTATLPPDPATVAPPLTTTGVPSFSEATSFLFSGPHPVQFGVQSGAIASQRVAVLRGRVLTREAPRCRECASPRFSSRRSASPSHARTAASTWRSMAAGRSSSPMKRRASCPRSASWRCPGSNTGRRPRWCSCHSTRA
ncbi:PA14 domain-containing protein [Myxococcus sp. 1LA]